MEISGLCAALWEAPDYLKRFTRREYKKAFGDYVQRFGPLFMEAVRAEEPSLLAAHLLDELEAAWAKQRFWNRGAVRVNEKQVLVDYLSPMLLGLEEPLCLALARALRDEWGRRWPKDTYRIADYSSIQSGFRNAIMGIDLAGKHIDAE